MRINGNHIWQMFFLAFFAIVVIDGMFLLEQFGYRPVGPVTPFEFIILALATFRLTRLFVYDSITAFFREQFYNVKKKGGKTILEKPAGGPRRTLAELVGCPWCFGVWAAATVLFFFFLSPLSWFPILFLALAGAGTFVQLSANLIGWKAEQLKRDVGDDA